MYKYLHVDVSKCRDVDLYMQSYHVLNLYCILLESNPLNTDEKLACYKSFMESEKVKKQKRNDELSDLMLADSLDASGTIYQLHNQRGCGVPFSYH